MTRPYFVEEWKKCIADKPDWKVDDLHGNSTAADLARRVLEWAATDDSDDLVDKADDCENETSLVANVDLSNVPTIDVTKELQAIIIDLERERDELAASLGRSRPVTEAAEVLRWATIAAKQDACAATIEAAVDASKGVVAAADAYRSGGAGEQ